MDQNISKLANSLNVAERKQALVSFLNDADWPSYRELATLFLNDPEKGIVKHICEAIIAKCPEKYIPELKLIAVSEDKESRVKALDYLASSENFKGLELLLERVPLEEPAVATKMKSAIMKMIEKNYQFFINPLLSCTGSDNEAVRKEALTILTSAGEPLETIKNFYLYMQAISPSIREKILLSARKDASWFIKNTKDLLSSDVDPNIRLQALILLQNFKAENFEDILLQEMAQKDWALKHYVIKTLAAMKSEKAKQLLIDAIEDKELSIQAIYALDSYRLPDIGIAFLRKLGKASDDEQMALLQGIKNVAASDKRYIEPLLVFAAHDVCKLPAKTLALEVVAEICVKTNTPKPAKAEEVEVQIKKLLLGDIPELNLKFAID